MPKFLNGSLKLLGVCFSLLAQASESLAPTSTLRENLNLPPYLDRKYGLIKTAELEEKLGISNTIVSKEDLATSFWRSILKLDQQVALAVEGLPIEELEVKSLKKLLNAQSESNDWIDVWWKIKFDELALVKSSLLQPSQPLLILARQHGFKDMNQSDWFVKIQSHLNKGDLGLGLRYFGDSTQKDIYLWTNEAQGLKTGNLWQWSQTQIELRYTKIDFWVTPISEIQLLGLNSLLNSQHALNMQEMLRYLSPIELVSKNMSEKFFENANLFQFKDNFENNPHSHTPDLSFEGIQFSDTSQLSTFKDYKSWEDRIFNRGPNPASLRH